MGFGSDYFDRPRGDDLLKVLDMGNAPLRKILRLKGLNDTLDSMGFTTTDLLDVLESRGRIRRVGTQGLFYTDMAEDDRYMRGLDERLLRDIAHGLNNKLVLKWSDTTRLDDAGRTSETIRHVSVDVVVSEALAKQWGDDDDVQASKPS